MHLGKKTKESDKLVENERTQRQFLSRKKRKIPKTEMNSNVS